MVERPPDKVTHSTTELPDGRVVFRTSEQWSVPPPKGTESDWIDRALERSKEHPEECDCGQPKSPEAPMCIDCYAMRDSEDAESD